MECRPDCAACCIAPSIAGALPNMPNGKKAGEACANLDLATLKCRIWGTPSYPDTCKRFKADEDVCGETRDQALSTLTFLEIQTQPGGDPS